MELAGQMEPEGGPWMAAALQRLSLGVIVAEAGGRPLYLNEAATEIIAAESGLLLRDGRLASRRRFETARLRSLIAAVAGNSTIKAQGMAIGGSPGERLQVVVVAPLRSRPEAPPATSIAGGAVLVLVSRPNAQDRAYADLLPQIFGLTRAETRLALGLSQGKALARIAKDSHVAVPTLRVQLRSILQKTGAARQADVVRLVLGVPLLH